MENEIRSQREDVLSQIKHLQGELNHLRNICKHGHVVYEYESSVGDVFSNDSYWVSTECIDCGLKEKHYENEDRNKYLLTHIPLNDRIDRKLYESMLKQGVQWRKD